jgi:signal transduction histidine kinase
LARTGRKARLGGRTLATAGVVLLAGGVAALTTVTSRRSIDRLSAVRERLEEAGTFGGARLRLYRRTFELLPPYIPGENALVDDVRIQLLQAGELGDRLPEAARSSLDHLSSVLSLPLVSKTDLLTASDVLERIGEAETEANLRLVDESLADLRRDRDVIWIGSTLLAILLVTIIWAAPHRLAAPLRPLMRFWIGGVLEQRRTALRLERMAFAGEAAASLAHELRNPLAGVIMGLSNLEHEAEELRPRLRPLLDELQRISRTLSEHLGALAGPTEDPSVVDLAGVLRDLAELLRYEAPPAVAIDIEAPGGLSLLTRRDRLRQALLNLGLNAVHAVGATGRVLFEAEQQDDGVVVKVLDSGPGFPPHVLQGSQPPLASTKEGGTGLGLRIVRRAVAELGGSLELANPPEGGAEVTVRLPASGAA